MVVIRTMLWTMLCILLIGSVNAGAVSTITIAPTAADGVYSVTAADLHNISSIDLRLQYDVSTLANPQVSVGAFATGTFMEVNTSNPGTVRMVFMTGGAINDQGQLATITFTKAGPATGRLTGFTAELTNTSYAKVAVQTIIGTPLASSSGDSATDTTTPSTSDTSAIPTFTVTAAAGEGGRISPDGQQQVNNGAIISFTLLPLDIYQIGTASGCNGNLSGTVYTTGPITGNCTVTVTFNQKPEPVVSSTTSSSTSYQEETETPKPSGGSMANLIDTALQQQQQRAGSTDGALDVTLEEMQQQATVVQQQATTAQQTTVTLPTQKKGEQQPGRSRANGKTTAEHQDLSPITASDAVAAPQPAGGDDSGRRAAKQVSGTALSRLVAIESPRYRFSVHKGARTLKELVPLFDVTSARTAGFVQTPAIAVSDGKTRFSVKLELAAAGIVPNFALKGANIKSIRPLSDRTWELSVLPQKDKSEVLLTILAGNDRADLSLVVVPPLDAAVGAETHGLSEAGVDALLAKAAAKPGKPMYDLNKDGKQDFLDDYILVAHYLRSRNQQQKTVKPVK